MHYIQNKKNELGRTKEHLQVYIHEMPLVLVIPLIFDTAFNKFAVFWS
jgi:hypothetical protein